MNEITAVTVYEVEVDGKAKRFDTIEDANEARFMNSIAAALMDISVPDPDFEEDDGEPTLLRPFAENRRKLRSNDPDRFRLNEEGVIVRKYARVLYAALKAIFEPGAVAMDAEYGMKPTELTDIMTADWLAANFAATRPAAVLSPVVKAMENQLEATRPMLDKLQQMTGAGEPLSTAAIRDNSPEDAPLPPIPAGIIWHERHDCFYTDDGRSASSPTVQAFREEWYARRAEFPTKTRNPGPY